MNEEIVNCDFVFKCPKQWDKMTVTEDDGVRFCGECQKDVYFADSYGKLDRFSREGKCVAVWQEIPVYQPQSETPEYVQTMTAGIPYQPDRKVEKYAAGETQDIIPSRIFSLLALIGFLSFGIVAAGLMILWFYLKS